MNCAAVYFIGVMEKLLGVTEKCLRRDLISQTMLDQSPYLVFKHQKLFKNTLNVYFLGEIQDILIHHNIISSEFSKTTSIYKNIFVLFETLTVNLTRN